MTEAEELEAQLAAEAFMACLDAYENAWRDVVGEYVKSIIQEFASVVQKVWLCRSLRDFKRSCNPYHRAKFHRNPKRRALRK